MSAPPDEARLALQKARAALRNGQLNQARQWAEQAAALAPQMEEPWLVLAAVASPPASLEYVKKALKINPESDLARRAMEWAMDRLRQSDRLGAAPAPAPTVVPGKEPNRAEVPAVQRAPEPARGLRLSPPKPRVAAILLGLGCIVFAMAAWATGLIPAVASLVENALSISGPTQPLHWAPVSIPKPTYNPQGSSSRGSVELAAAAPWKVLYSCVEHTLNLAAQLPAAQPTETAVALPTAASESQAAIPTSEPAWSGSLSMETVPDTPTAGLPGEAVALATDSQHWLDVDLTQQTVNAYAGDSLVSSLLASTGALRTPTMIRTYHI